LIPDAVIGLPVSELDRHLTGLTVPSVVLWFVPMSVFNRHKGALEPVEDPSVAVGGVHEGYPPGESWPMLAGCHQELLGLKVETKELAREQQGVVDLLERSSVACASHG